MKNFKQYLSAEILLLACISLFLLFFSPPSQSASIPAPVAQAVAQVVWVKGEVKAIGENKVSRTLQRRDVVYAHDTLVTNASGSGQIVFTDNTLVSLSPNSEMNISQYQYTHGAAPSEDKYIVKVVKGGFRTISGAIAKSNPDNYQVNTPVATIGVRGTQWAVNIVDGKMFLKIETGSITIRTPSGDMANLTQGTDKLYATIDLRAPSPTVSVSSEPPPGAFTTQPPIENTTSTLPTSDSNPAAAGSTSGETGTSGGSDSGSSSGSSSDSSGSSDSGSSTSDTSSTSSSESSSSNTSDSGTTASTESGTSTDTGAASTSTSSPSPTSGNGKSANSFCIQ